MSSMQVHPSEAEVNAIKQQLKLLGHTLPTDVIVKFLQDNSGLLTAYQQPDVSRGTSPGQSNHCTLNTVTRRKHLAKVQPGFATTAKQPGLQALPQLDVAWASAASSQQLRRGRPAQGMFGSSQTAHGDGCGLAFVEAQTAAIVRRDGCHQRLCSRDRMTNTHADVFPSQGLNSNSALESDFHMLKAELEELSAGLPRSEQHPSTTQAHLSTSSTSQAHPVLKGPPFGSSNHRWYSAVDHISDDCNEPLQHRKPRDGNVPSEQRVNNMYQQHDRHSQSHWSAEDASHQGNHQDSSHRGGTQGEEGAKHGSRGQSIRPRSVLGCSSVRSLPVLNNSFIVPAQAVKPKKVDRVTRYRELQHVWNKDAFLRSGGSAKTSKRRGENFTELYAACHAAEDKLKDLTLKHGKAAKGVGRSKAQQENVAPTEKRRDALRWETRKRMQLRDDHY